MKDLLTPRLVIEALIAAFLIWAVVSQTLLALAEIQ
jgi:hypothetical protein